MLLKDPHKVGGILCPHTKFPLSYIGGILCPHMYGESLGTRLPAYLDDLPEQPQDEVGPSLHDVFRADVDDVAADGAGGVEGQRLVLVDGEGV